MKKFKKAIAVGLLFTLGVTTLTGCSSLKKEMQEASANNIDIKLTVEGETNTKERNKIEWTELDQLTTHKSLRKEWDEATKIVKFDMGSKNGVMFVDLEGNWAGNNTLYNVFQNKEFVKEYWEDSNIRSSVAQPAISEFSDVTNEVAGLLASVNAYFNIMPTNSDGTSGLAEIISRAEAMSAVYRADTPVIFGEEDADFKRAVSDSEYNLYAFGVTKDSYLDYANGSLNYDTYNSAITKAEEIYLLMHRYFDEELKNTSTSGSAGFTDCKNAGNIASKIGVEKEHGWQSYELEYCLQNSKKGAPETLYKALVLANKLGIIGDTTNWNKSITGAELLQDIIKVYEVKGKNDGYAVNAKSGANEGSSLLAKAEEKEPEKTTSTVQVAKVEKIKDVTKIDDLVDVYGDELDMSDEELNNARFTAEGFTFEPVDKRMKVDYCYYLNVRVGPSTDFEIIRSVPVGTEVHVVARCVENGWYRIIANGKIVYQCGVYFSEL